MTLATTVREAARRFGSTAAFVAADGWALTYTELDGLSDRAAVDLAARGVGEGDVVALVLPSTPDYVVAYAAIAKLGAITTGVNPRFTAHERSAVLLAAQPKLIIATADLADSMPTDVDIVIIERAARPDEILAGLTATSPDATSFNLGDVDLDDPERVIAIVFTSGTTGLPKGAVFGHRELAAITTADVGDRWGGGGAMLASTQFAHVGFMTKLPWYLRLGTTTYLIDRWRARDVLQLIHDHRMTSLGGVAPQLALLLRDPTFDDLDLSCVQTIIMGGALSPPALVREARERFGAAYSIRYSSTESGGIGTGTAFDADEDEALSTVGRPRGDVEIAIRDEHDQPVAGGTTGELCLRSSAMMRGYWHNPHETAAAIRDGWLHTGDLALIDEVGCLRLKGRRTEMFIRGGYNVYPAEVEAVLGTHPAVADVAVVPADDEVLGEIGVAVTVVRAGETPPDLDDLRLFAADRLASYKLPERLVLVDELPLTPMQKVDRRALRFLVGG